VNNTDRNKAFRAALTQQLALQRSLSKAATDELIVILTTIAQQITLVLSRQPSDYQQWFLPQIMQQIETTLQGLQQQGSSALNLSLDKSAEAGMLQLDNALRPAGISISAIAPLIDTRMLANIKSFHVYRIADITKVAASAIELELSKVLIGAQSPFDAQKAITAIMGDSPAYRIKSIVRTSMASVYSKSAQDRYAQAANSLPGLKKRWYQSGKRHPRLTHVLAHLQTKLTHEPFQIGHVKMMHPHDPTAPASEVISCGCSMRPFMDGWDVIAPASKTNQAA
jgi:hypothetical protein